MSRILLVAGKAVGLDGVMSGTPSSAGIFPITLAVKEYTDALA